MFIFDHDRTRINKVTLWVGISNQKISSVHQIILAIQQMLQCHDLIGHIHFENTHPIVIKISFSSPEFISAWKIIPSWVQTILEDFDQSSHTDFDHPHPNIFQILLSKHLSQTAKYQAVSSFVLDIYLI